MYENQEQDVLRIKEAVERAQMENAKNAPMQPDMNQGHVAESPMAGGSMPYLTGTSGQRRYTRADLHEKEAATLQLSAKRSASAAQFLRAHPEFETFLDLIKDGAITLY